MQLYIYIIGFVSATILWLLYILIYDYHKRKKTPYRFIGEVEINNFKIKGENLMTVVTVNTVYVNGSFGEPKDKNGNTALVQEGSLQILSTDDSILTVGPNPDKPEDPYAFRATFSKKAGVAQVQIKADADLGEGVKTIEGAESFEFPLGEAVGFGQAVIDATVEG